MVTYSLEEEGNSNISGKPRAPAVEVRLAV